MVRLISGAVAVVLVIIGISLFLAPDDLAGCKRVEQTGDCRAADAIIVVSGGDTLARTDGAIDLFHQGWASLIIFSGAAADKDGPSNAKAMQDHALKQGVPIESTMIEELSETTKQNAEQVKRQLAEDEIKSIILVTSGYHMRRTGLEFTNQFSDIEVRRHPIASDNQWSAFWWLSPRGWWMAGSELVKIILFFAGGSR